MGTAIATAAAEPLASATSIAFRRATMMSWGIAASDLVAIKAT